MTEATTGRPTLVDTYIDMWNETDVGPPGRAHRRRLDRRRRLHRPAARGDRRRSAISEMVDGVHGQLPGHRFRLTSGIDSHHDSHRFGWELAAADGTVAVEGIDVAEVGPDGRLVRITGFFGALPEVDA